MWAGLRQPALRRPDHRGGEQITASETEHAELFWALHGGGGNFGIATSLTFRLHPLPVYSMALLLWPAESGRAVVGAFRDLFAGGAPEEVGGGVIYLTGPPEDFVPADLVDQLSVAVLVTVMGDEVDLRARIGPLLALRPRGEVITELPYADLQCMLDDPPGMRNYWSADYLTDLPDPAIDAFCAAGEAMLCPSPSQLGLIPWGGAVARDAGSSAMARRDASWVVHPFGLWTDPAQDDTVRDWVRGVGVRLTEWTTGGTYLNFIGDEGADRVRAGFGEHYARLAAVKALYDPDNVFNRWHNVRPETVETIGAPA